MKKIIQKWQSALKGEEKDLISVTVAVCVMLLEVAGADDEFSAAERDRIRQALQVRFSLSPEEAQELMEISADQRRRSLDLWRFTNRLNEALSREEKRKVLLEVWRVIYSDGALSGHEDYFVHHLVRLLNLSHRELIDAKLQALGEMRSS